MILQELPPDEQPFSSYHRRTAPYEHQVDLDASDENVAPDSLGTPDIMRESSPISHLVFTPIIRQSIVPSVQLESVNETNPETPRGANDVVLQYITNQYIDPFEVFPEQFREETVQADTGSANPRGVG